MTYDGWAEMNEKAWEDKNRIEEENKFLENPSAHYSRLKLELIHFQEKNSSLEEKNRKLQEQINTSIQLQRRDEIKAAEVKSLEIKVEEMNLTISSLKKELSDSSIELHKVQAINSELRNLILNLSSNFNSNPNTNANLSSSISLNQNRPPGGL